MSDTKLILEQLELLKNAVYEESKDRSKLIRYIHEIEGFIDQKKFGDALALINDLEELMDLEFCQF